MAIEKMKLKNNATNLMGLVWTLLIVLAVFFGCYAWVSDNVISSGLSLDSKYNDTYSSLQNRQDELDTEINSMKSSFDDMKEADNTFQVAWNGLKGLGKALLLPISFVSVSLDTWTAIVPGLGILPSWVRSLIFIGIIAFVVFLVLAILKGEPKLSS